MMKCTGCLLISCKLCIASLPEPSRKMTSAHTVASVVHACARSPYAFVVKVARSMTMRESIRPNFIAAPGRG
jgi:hypothetical protein